MTLADNIREFVRNHYIKPTREGGEDQITVRSGDVHERMKLKSRMPAVCGAIGTEKFEILCNVRLIDRKGPTQGANVFFTFEIL